LTARQLGGGWRAQVVAAVAAAASTQYLAACHLLSTTAFDLLFGGVPSPVENRRRTRVPGGDVKRRL
jgi:hypothetical protein